MMKYFVYLINCLLVLSIPLMILSASTEEVMIAKTDIAVKKVKSTRLVTNSIKTVTEEQEAIVEEESTEEENVEQAEDVEQKEEVVTPAKKEEIVPEESPPKKVEQPPEQKETDVLRTLTGKMSGYGPDCSGCSGYTKSGFNAKASIYYPDSQYGSVRVFAADRSISFGSIVRVKNSKLGSFLGIVLDRGSGVGIGKSSLFDLLFPSENDARIFGVSWNVTFEVIRDGY